MPVNLLDAGSAVINGRLYVAAGKDGVGPKKTLLIYDSAANGWSQGADLPANYPAVENPAGVALNGKVYLFGGSTQPFTGAVANAAVYDPATNQWTDLAPMATPRGGATAQVLAGKIYVLGGMDGTGASLSSVEVYDPANNSWSAGPAMGKARDNPGSAVLGGKIYVFGGRTRFASGGEEAGTATSVEMFDPGHRDLDAEGQYAHRPAHAGRRAARRQGPGDRRRERGRHLCRERGVRSRDQYLADSEPHAHRAAWRRGRHDRHRPCMWRAAARQAAWQRRTSTRRSRSTRRARARP